MKKTIKTKAILSWMLVAVLVFTLSASPVMAEGSNEDLTSMKKMMLQTQSVIEDDDDDEEEEGDPYETGIGVHADPAVFEKNFDLSWEQKKVTIQEIEKMVLEDAKITSDMSDLEKYYRLAIAANKRVSYDWDFWCGRYMFDYYSHQWDSYGCLFESSVCAGIAIFYSHLCHAADLPCWFVRMDPKILDHTIDFIPNINGNAYYIDVTENMFFMSEDASPWNPIDKDFSHVKEYTEVTECEDNTFNYLIADDDFLGTAGIKQCWDMPYEDWFDEYALHNNTTRNFPTDYVEKGSGLSADEKGYHHVSYNDYGSNFVEPGHDQVWFLDDFYKNPKDLEDKILHKEFDDQLLNVSGVRKSYDCADKNELESLIAQDISDHNISVEYFPSSNDGETVVAESAGLEAGTDYEITCTDYDADAKTAELTITGKGSYSGTYQFSVLLNSAVVTQPPVPKKGLTYTGKAQDLIEEGEAEGGVMQYALGTENEPTEEFATAIPAAADAGAYYVWYKVAGEDGHEDSDAVCMKPAVKIAPITLNIIVDDELEIKAGETAKISPRLNNAKIQAKFTFNSWNEDIATVDDNGLVTGVKGGVVPIYVDAELQDSDSNYEIEDDAMVMVEVIEPFDISETKVRFVKSSATYNGKVQKPAVKTVKGWKLKAGTDYTVVIKNSKGKKVSSPKAAGTYKVIVKGTGRYYGWTDATYTIKKAANPMTLKAKPIQVKYNDLKKKTVSIKKQSAFAVNKAEGKLSYKLVSAKNGKKSFKKYFKINAKTGKVTVKKGLKKGTYKVRIKVTAKGDLNYKAGSKTVTAKIKVQ